MTYGYCQKCGQPGLGSGVCSTCGTIITYMVCNLTIFINRIMFTDIYVNFKTKNRI